MRTHKLFVTIYERLVLKPIFTAYIIVREVALRVSCVIYHRTHSGFNWQVHEKNDYQNSPIYDLFMITVNICN